MKTLEFQFTGGGTPVVFVCFYNEDFKDKLKAEDANFFDQLDFLSANEAKSIWLGRGMCREGWHTVEISQDGERVDVNDHVYIYEGANPPTDDDKETFRDDNDVEYGTVLTASYSAMIDSHRDNRIFGDIDKYFYASVEKVETYSASASVTIEVEDDWKWTDFDVVYVDMDSGGSWGESFTQEMYADTNLEQELFGINYKGKLYEVQSEYEGGTSEWTYYEKDQDGNWNISDDVTELMEEKEDDW